MIQSARVRAPLFDHPAGAEIDAGAAIMKPGC